ncbi:MAG TPA: hypothetical protein VEQ58_14825 [Polyangiaceae bacterium]|nr:hypothetical protein [Polyangiaceae bacterium]
MIVEREIHGKKLRAECRVGTEAQLGSVLETFQRVESPRIGPGLELRFGWSLLHLVQDGDALRVSEPAFDSWPLPRFEPTLDITLQVVGDQVSLLKKLGVTGQDTFFDQMVLAAPRALSAHSVFLRRDEPSSETDSGWALGSTQDPEALANAEDLEAVPSAALLSLYPSLLSALTLPLGFVAIFSGPALVQVFDADGHSLALL